MSSSGADDQRRQALDDLFTAAYRELSRLASAIRRADANATIGTSTLVHETWLKLARSERLTSESPLHLKRVVAQAMRQYVVEAARRRCASKRGGGPAPAVVVTLDAGRVALLWRPGGEGSGGRSGNRRIHGIA